MHILNVMIGLLEIAFRDLLNPEFYINNGGLWMLLFIVFAETGLMIGFFLPGDSLLFAKGCLAGIVCHRADCRRLAGRSGVRSEMDAILNLFA